MDTCIGEALRSSTARRICAGIIGFTAVSVDILLSSQGYCFALTRAVPAGAAVLLLAATVKGEPRTLGLTLRPRQGFLYWVKATVLIGLAVGAFSIAVLLILSAAGHAVSFPALSPAHLPRALFHTCVIAPALEEPIYRLLFCVPFVALIGPRWTIACAGAVFAALHFAYGNPGADNFIAGYFLAWAYIKSESLLIPTALHSLGNACVTAFQLGTWYMTT